MRRALSSAHRILGRSAALFMALAVLCVCRAARAGDAEVRLSVSFDVNASAAPAYLCAIAKRTPTPDLYLPEEPHTSDSASPIAKRTPAPDVKLGQAPPGKGKIEASPARIALLSDLKSLLDDPPRSPGYRVLTQPPSMLPAALKGQRGPLLDALGQLWKGSEQERKGSEQETCGPRFEVDLSRDERIFCVHNSAMPGQTEGPVVVLHLGSDIENVNVSVDQLALDGGAALLLLGYAKVDEAIKGVTVSVAGGSYLAVPARASVGTIVSFPLVPRCSERKVRLPPHSFGATPLLTATLDKHEIKPISLDGDAIAVRVENSLDGKERELKLTLGSSARSNQELVAVAEWTSPEPPAPLVAHVRGIHFTWARNCLYSAERCPTVTLPRVSGTTCDPAAANANPSSSVCEYSCNVESTSFDLPVDVRFTDPSGNVKWDDQVRFANQELLEYLPAGERQVTVSFERWPANVWARAGETIDAVDVRAPGGATFRVKPKAEHVTLRIPDLGCSDHLSYRVLGDREYYEETQSLEKQRGTLTLKSPSESVSDAVRLGVTLGLGAQLSPLGFAANASTRPVGSILGILRLRPPGITSGWRPDVELRTGAIFTQTWFRTLATTDALAATTGGSAVGVADTAWVIRVPLTLAFIWHPWGSFYLGHGAGVSFTLPLLDSEKERMYVQARLALSAILGYRLSRAAALEGRALFIVDEATAAYTFNYAGSPVRTPENSSFLLLDLAFRLDF